MFESLTSKLTVVFGRLGNKGRLTEKDVDEALREVRMAFLDADVHFKVARSFTESLKDKVLNEDILTSLTAGQQVVKAANDELVFTLGGKTETLLQGSKKPSVILVVGLNGSGKTTTAVKLAYHLENEGQITNLVAADVHRPAAIDQLITLSENIGLDVFHMRENKDVSQVAQHGIERGRSLGASWTVIDTAGRSQIDEDLMLELEQIKKAIEPDEVLLVVDAMTGQESVNVAREFHDRIGVSGLVLTKMDGDARGGAALSITSVTGIPVKFIGTGERVDGLELFHPDRLASRILGMGDVLTLVEKAQATFDQEQAHELEKKMRQDTFDLEDFLDQMQAIKKMGSMGQILDMIPGFSSVRNNMGAGDLDGSHLVKTEAIIQSMTLKERQRPELISGSRRRRIAKGSGTMPQDVNQLLNQFKQIRKMMKDMSSTHGQQKLLKMISQR